MPEVPVESAFREGAADPARNPTRGAAGHRRRWWFAIIGLVVVGATLWAVRRSSTSAPQRGPDAQATRPVPVTATPVARRDVPIYLDGLGSVVAFKTVTVRPQVDGRLAEVLFKEGQAVRTGQVLAQIDPRPLQSQLRQAEGALARDAAQLTSARLNLERYRALAQEKLVPQQQADDQAGIVGQLEGTVQVDKASIETARLNLEYARITSPIDGVTGIRLVDQGNVVHASDPGGIVIVTQLDPVAVIFTLPQDHLPALAEAMGQGPLAVEAFGRDGTLLGSGPLELIDNQINQATSTIRLKAVLPNPRRALWPNQFVNARLRLAVRKGALVMPATAVQRGPNGVFVYVIGADATVSPRPIELETSQGDIVLVARGLQEGERVVVDGQNLLRPGSRVAAREPAKAPGSTPIAAEGADAARSKAPTQ